jgi:phenylacetate-coenzyme A ligase PaaK-like adenylate-forming protein
MIRAFSQIRPLEVHHQNNCSLYKNFVLQEFPDWDSGGKLENLPFLPVQAFKYHSLKSVSDEEIFRVMSSSGTTGRRSTIYLDKDTSIAQSRALASSIVSEFGNSRFPMVFIDGAGSRSDVFTASKAAANGFSLMAKKSLTLTSSPEKSDIENLIQFCELYDNERVVFFGFTFNVWLFLITLAESGIKNLSKDSILLHGGGWKKLESSKVSSEEFAESAGRTLGTTRVSNYYGMVEQTGSIYFECILGSMHEPETGTFIIRDERTLTPLPHGQRGYIQLISSIQSSYPGHSVLTEDLGYSLPYDKCNCGNQGKILRVIGRAEAAEIRGCSDAQLS